MPQIRAFVASAAKRDRQARRDTALAIRWALSKEKIKPEEH